MCCVYYTLPVPILCPSISFHTLSMWCCVKVLVFHMLPMLRHRCVYIWLELVRNQPPGFALSFLLQPALQSLMVCFSCGFSLVPCHFLQSDALKSLGSEYFYLHIIELLSKKNYDKVLQV